MQAERALVGMIMREPKHLGAALARGVTLAHFEDGECREILTEILRAEMEGRSFDALSLLPLMPSSYATTLVQLEDQSPISMNVEYFADEVLAASWRKRALADLLTAITVIRGAEPFSDLDPLKSRLVALGGLCTAETRTKTSFTSRELLEAVIGETERRANIHGRGESIGVPTGFPVLDRVIHGMVPGRLIVVGARPKVGKTTMALNMAFNAATAGHGIAYFTHEMSPVELGFKVAAIGSDVPSERFTLGRVTDVDCDKLMDFVRSRGLGMTLFVEHMIDPCFETACFRARQLKRTHGIKAIVIDYVGQFHVDSKHFGGSKQAEVSYMTSRLKRLAAEEDLCVIALAQINRKGVETDEPEIHHLKDSGSFEQDADHVILLWQDEDAGLLTSVAANRHGPTCKFKLATNLATSLVTEETGKYDNGVRKP